MDVLIVDLVGPFTQILVEVSRKGRPGATKDPAHRGTDFDIQLGMIDMHDLPGAITMAWGRAAQLPIPGRVLVGRTCSFPLSRLFGPATEIETAVEGAL